MNRISYIVIIVSFLFILVIAIWLGSQVKDPAFLPEIDNDFKIGFVASLWEDILFFLVVTLAVIVAQYLSQTPDSFVVKMKSIFGQSVKYTDSLHVFIEGGVKELLAYFTKVFVQIEILSVSDDNKMVEVQFIRKIIVGNLSKDSSAIHQLRIDIEPENTAGERHPVLFDIESAEISSENLEDPDTREVIYKGRVISEPIDDRGSKYIIPPGKFRWYKYAIKSWKNVEENARLYHLTQYRYIKSAEIVIRNSSSCVIKLRSKTPKGSSEFTLNRHTDHKFLPNIVDNSETSLYEISIISID